MKSERACRVSPQVGSLFLIPLGWCGWMRGQDGAQPCSGSSLAQRRTKERPSGHIQSYFNTVQMFTWGAEAQQLPSVLCWRGPEAKRLLTSPPASVPGSSCGKQCTRRGESAKCRRVPCWNTRRPTFWSFCDACLHVLLLQTGSGLSAAVTLSGSRVVKEPAKLCPV